ncbi:MAG: hypothetical protein UX07_C0004G0019 [Parcubacteria group bacterium GW2011_GWA2_45_30]|nr:MAG: hypothetical protein UX07_C0004G0019 [Parcubacteria group bacterium GW2011_GWA2_45_30]
MRTSYSAIGTYLQCPQKYEFQNINRIRVPKNREAIFGTLIHSTLKFMFTSNPLFPTLDEVIAHFRKNWPLREVFEAESKHDPRKLALSGEGEKAYFEEGVKMLKKFYEKNAPWNFIILDLESRFEVMIADEKTGETHILAGIIDRIDKFADGKYEIIDYKTGKRMPSQDALNSDLQLSLYSLGLQKRWPHIKPGDITLSLYFLKHGEKLSTQPSVETTAKTKEHILKTIAEIQEKIKTGKEFEPMPSALCNWCGYRPMCPAWKHLYRKSEIRNPKSEIENVIKEYFEIKKADQKNDARLKELQEQIKKYMEQEGLTRVFGDGGMISKKIIQRYEYDMEKIKALLSPIGKWEDILEADETKLKKIMKEIPEEIRTQIMDVRKVAKEYASLTTSFNKITPD